MDSKKRKAMFKEKQQINYFYLPCYGFDNREMKIKISDRWLYIIRFVDF